MKKTRQVFLVALATSFTLPTIAEEQSPIIVTATRTAQTVDESLASVTVITKEQIEQQQSNDLTDLLSSLAGIDMINNGGYGKSTSLYMRGTNTGHTLVLIDGVKIGSATLGQVSYQNIPIEHIERIEIVRGARATLYGSDAIGGVIQIFTRKPKDKIQKNFSSMLGSYNTNKMSTGITGQKNNTSYSIQASTFSTEGFNSRQNNDQDRDGFDQKSFNLFLKQHISKTNYIEAMFLHSMAKNEYDGSTTTTYYESDTLQEVVGIKGTFDALSNWKIKINANQSKDNSDELENNIKKDEFNTKRTIINFQNDITFNENNLLTLGLEHKDTSISGTSAHTKKSRNNKSLYLQHSWSDDTNDLLVSLRGDDNEAFGKYSTGSVAWGQKIFNETSLILSAATAFKAPSFNDLYYPNGATSAGNPDVLPEESENLELSIKQKQIQINIYSTTIKNLIAWDNATGKWIPSNVAAAKINGVEFIASTELDGWKTKVNLSLSDPIDTATGKVLKNRSRESVRLDFDKDFTSYSLGATIKSQGKRYSTNELPEYTLIDFRTSYKINEKWNLNGKITNVFNREYQASDGYNSPDRSIFISIAYKGF